MTISTAGHCTYPRPTGDRCASYVNGSGRDFLNNTTLVSTLHSTSLLPDDESGELFYGTDKGFSQPGNERPRLASPNWCCSSVCLSWNWKQKRASHRNIASASSSHSTTSSRGCPSFVGNRFTFGNSEEWRHKSRDSAEAGFRRHVCFLLAGHRVGSDFFPLD